METCTMSLRQAQVSSFVAEFISQLRLMLKQSGIKPLAGKRNKANQDHH